MIMMTGDDLHSADAQRTARTTLIDPRASTSIRPSVAVDRP
jgi:hypothetical protein